MDTPTARVFPRLLAALGLMLIGFVAGWASSGRPLPGRAGHMEARSVAMPSLPGGSASAAAAAVAPQDTTGRVARPLPPGVRAVQTSLRAPTEISRIMHTVAAIDQLPLGEIPEAMAFAQGLAGEERSIVLTAIVARWSELDAPAAAQWLLRDKGGELSRRIIGGVVSEWAARDPAAAREWVKGVSKDDHSSAVEGYFSALGSTVPAQGLAEIAALPDAERNEARRHLYKGWAMIDLPGAYRQALLEPPGVERRNLYGELLSTWAERDPGAALAAGVELQQHAPDAAGADLAGGILKKWAQNSPAAALGALLKLPEEARARAAEVTFDGAFSVDPDVAQSFLDQLPPGKGADGAKLAAVSWLTERDPAKGAALLEAMPSGPERDTAIERLSMSWSREDPAAAAQWLGQLPDSTPKVAATRNLIGSWVTNDPVASGAWLQQLTPGAAYDAAATLYGERIVDKDPPVAIEWATSVGDPRLREQAVRSLLEKWVAADAPSARAWLQTSRRIDPDLRSYFLRMP